MRRAAAVFALLGCAGRPPLSGVGEASPPGFRRNTNPATVFPVEAREAPRHDAHNPLRDLVPGAPAGGGAAAQPTPETPAAEAAAGVVWEDPDGRVAPALQAFRTGEHALHVIQLGDSHTEGDAFTGALRRRLWARLGDGGRGFVPIAGDQWDVVRTLTGPWRVVRSGLRPSDAPDGLGLSRAIATSPQAVLRVATCTRCVGGRSANRITVYFRTLTSGGRFRVEVDGRALELVSTRGGGRYGVDVPDGAHAVAVRPEGDGPVEIYGVALDRSGDGARVDSAGIVGAQASHLLAEDWTVLTSQLADRAPTLVVLAFGTNESVSARRDPAEHGAALATLLERVRAAVPTATLAVFGPPDTELRSTAQPGTFIPAPRLDGVISAARATAAAAGAAFVDLRALMGGPGAMQAWSVERPPWAEPDHVHLTARGYAHLADALVEALLGPAPGAPPP